MKAAVVGATGYTGQVLLRLLSRHPDIQHIYAVSSSKGGESLSEQDPGLGPLGSRFEATGGKFLSVDEAAALKPDVVFAALPHLASATVCGPFFGQSVVIDLSADFRIKDEALFERAYGQKPPRPDLLSQAVYGLAEWHTESIRKADLIANPGCYPTCSLTPLLPLYRDQVIQGRAVINAVSGISGAGKKADLKYLLTERAESVEPYNPGTRHRHSQEIGVELSQASPEASLIFNPHLVPMKRGMEATITVELRAGCTGAEVEASWNRAYGGRPFVVNRGTRLPSTAQVWGSNRVDMAWHQEGSTLILFSVLDNLVKGASGQAVQNMNLRFGLEETAGLSLANEI